jgi:hypothetical protein
MAKKYLNPNINETIPQELKELSQWITWDAGEPDQDGKFDKYPKGRDGTGSAWQQPHQWSTYEEAKAAAKNDYRSGIGLVLPVVLPDGSNLVALDYDGVDISNPNNNPRFEEMLQTYDQLGRPYTEVSPSKKGLRMFVRSKVLLPQVTRINPLGGKDELFCKSRKWVTTTGDHVGGSEIPDCTLQLIKICEEWQEKKHKRHIKVRETIKNESENLDHQYARVTQTSLLEVLSKIDCSDEPSWFDVANILARVYGEDGRIFFERFSRGDYGNKPYPKFDLEISSKKYDRALRELIDRPNGYGVRHLIELAGMSEKDVEFESQVDFSEQQVNTELKSEPNSVAICFSAIGRNKKPQQVSENLQVVLDVHGITARYNQISKRSELLVPNLQCVKDESDNTALTTVTDLAIKSGMTANRVPELLDAIAAQNPYCPVRTYIESHPWDGSSRFAQFLQQIICGNPTLASLLWRKWLIQAVAAVYELNGISNAGVITLTGPQNIGKTSLFRAMTSEIKGVFLEGQTLNPADKDSVLTAVAHWIVELGELDATFKKAEIAQLKAFVTKQSDTVRRPYARKDSRFPRRTVFAGTVNDFQFLHDLTGNRRFWPIAVDNINLDPSLDYQQLWAEVKSWYDSGDKWFLNTQELTMLTLYSEQFMVSDPDIEALLEKYPFAGCTQWSPELMKNICFELRIDHPTKAQTMKLANAIRKYNGGQKPQITNQGGRHFVPDLNAIKAAANSGSVNLSSAVGPVAPVKPVL